MTHNSGFTGSSSAREARSEFVRGRLEVSWAQRSTAAGTLTRTDIPLLYLPRCLTRIVPAESLRAQHQFQNAQSIRYSSFGGVLPKSSLEISLAELAVLVGRAGMSRPAGGLGSPMMLVAKGYRLVQRDLQFLMPESMRDWLPASDPVWLVINVVAGLDTWGVHARRRTRGAGRAGYDPDMFLTLLIWTWAHGVRPSRVIERMCQRELAFRIICGGDWPDHVTIARFRAGAQLLPECRAVRLDADRTQVRHVICEHRSGMLAIKAKVVVLAAGALVTPVLLLNEPSRHVRRLVVLNHPAFGGVRL